MTKSQADPLAGIKVVEFGQNLAGPYCGQVLAFLAEFHDRCARDWG